MMKSYHTIKQIKCSNDTSSWYANVHDLRKMSHSTCYFELSGKGTLFEIYVFFDNDKDRYILSFPAQNKCMEIKDPRDFYWNFSEANLIFQSISDGLTIANVLKENSRLLLDIKEETYNDDEDDDIRF